MPDIFIDRADNKQPVAPIDGDPTPAPGSGVMVGRRRPSRWWLVFAAAAVVVLVGMVL